MAAADRIVLPGVGAFADCRAGLDAVAGMAEALRHAVLAKGRPFFGICVGMQLMASRGLEHGSHPGFDWGAGDVGPIEPLDSRLKIPHMGWNYGFRAADAGAVKARVDYGGPLTAVVGRDNLIGTQFHPEKSQATGLRMIANFLSWRP